MDEGDKGQRPRASELPVDLTKEREAFVRTFLRRGVEFAEELLEENSDLRKEIGELQRENTRLRAQVASDDAMRDLVRSMERLEQEKEALLKKSVTLEESSRRHAGRYAQLENELHELANLYVASYQLHASLSARRVVRHVGDVLNQFVGARSYVIYVIEDDGSIAHPIAWEGMLSDDLRSIRVGEGPIGEPCLTGISKIREDGHLQGGSMQDPIAVLAMTVDGRPVGVIAVVSLLEQKESWASVDKELFKMLASHAGIALIAANLFSNSHTRAAGPVLALDGLREHLKPT